MSLTKDDLGQIKTIVNDVVHGVVNNATAGLATKAELNSAVSGLATKKDLERYSTEDELMQAVSRLATKLDLERAVVGLATKADLRRTEGRLLAAMNLLERDTFSALTDHEARITRLERASGPKAA